MFAPLAVDIHDSAAAALFAMTAATGGGNAASPVVDATARGRYGPRNVLGAAATDHQAGNGVAGWHGADGHTAIRGPHAGGAAVGSGGRLLHGGEGTGFGSSSRDGGVASTEAAAAEEAGVQGPRTQLQEQQAAARGRAAARQRTARHRTRHAGALSGSVLVRPHSAPGIGGSSRWGPQVGALTLHPPSTPPLSSAALAARDPRPAFTKARAAAAATEAAAAEAAAAAAASQAWQGVLLYQGAADVSQMTARRSGPAPALGCGTTAAAPAPPNTRPHCEVQQGKQGSAPLRTRAAARACDVRLTFNPGAQRVRVHSLPLPGDARAVRGPAPWATIEVGTSAPPRPAVASAPVPGCTHAGTCAAAPASLHPSSNHPSTVSSTPAAAAGVNATRVGPSATDRAGSNATQQQLGQQQELQQGGLKGAGEREGHLAGGGTAAPGCGGLGAPLSMVDAFKGVVRQVRTRA